MNTSPGSTLNQHCKLNVAYKASKRTPKILFLESTKGSRVVLLDLLEARGDDIMLNALEPRFARTCGTILYHGECMTARYSLEI
jgi:hypothetical protein